MKKIATAALSFSLLFSACLPVFSQKTRLASGSIGASAQFDRVEAFSDGRGVLVQWQMVSETRNTGFYVYRVGEKGLEKVSEVMVLGSAARVRDRTLTAEKYQQYDPKGTTSTVYVVESVTMYGDRILSGQTGANFVRNLSLVADRSTEEFETAANSTNGDIEKTIMPEPSKPEKAPNLAAHRAVVAQPGVKIAVKSEGLYRITRAELQAAGFNLSGNSANWRLFMEGIEQAILIGPNDQYIEFYGKGRDDVESDTRVYYLIADTTGGKRMEQGLVKSIFGSVVANNFVSTLEKKQRLQYFGQLENGDGDNYVGLAVQETVTTIIVNLPGVDVGASGNITLTLKMLGFSSGPHAPRLVINGHDVGTVTGSGFNSYSGQKSVPVSFLLDGANTLELSTGTATDQNTFDSVTVDYPRKFQADKNSLMFTSPGRKTAVLSGFSSPNIRVFDISIDGRPLQVPNLQVVQNGCSYGVKIPSYRGRNLFAQADTPDPRTAPSANWNAATDEVTLTGHQFFTGLKGRITTTGTLPGGVVAATDYYVRVSGCDSVSLYDTLAHATNLVSTTGKIDITSAGSGNHTFTPSSVLQAASVTPNVPSTLSTVNHNAKLVIISFSAPDFMAAANTWANYRHSQGFSVEVVDIADIYDEFSYGSLNSQSIKDFLSFSRSWNTPPQYVLLIGDATYDPRNYEGYGDFDLIPSKRFDSFLSGETVSDDALVDFDNDGLAEMAIGRIPARTASVITTIFNKTVAFETPAQQSLSRGGAFAYDFPDGTNDFAGDCQAIRTQLPGMMPVEMINRASPGSTATLINSMNTGKYIVNYCGHGSSGNWAVNFFNVGMVPQLTNASSQSIYTMLTCLNGYFIRLDFDSLSEALIKDPNGGAVATWASSGETTTDIQLIMGKRFYGEIASGNIKRIGDLVIDAKGMIPFDPDDMDVRYSWVLLGDPMLKIRQ